MPASRAQDEAGAVVVHGHSSHACALALVPTRIRRLRVERDDRRGRAWLLAMLRRECRRFGCGVEAGGDAFALRWP